jgi:hypothetical protein
MTPMASTANSKSVSGRIPVRFGGLRLSERGSKRLPRVSVSTLQPVEFLSIPFIKGQCPNH